MARRHREDAVVHSLSLSGERVLCDPSGVLVVPDEKLLIVSDLHLEKGAAFARRGSFLPPYDTGATLALLQAALLRHQPRRVVCLGDSFHDRHGAELMPEPFRAVLVRLMAGRDWLWITGNHDPLPPAGVGGDTAETMNFGPLSLRHEPSRIAAPGEIAGHLHPVATVRGKGGMRRSACFASDGKRMILPSFGVSTGGLNVLDRAFEGLFEAACATAFVIGLTRIYPIGFSRLAR